MAETPAGDEILTDSDAVDILEELTEALGHANILGVMLSIKPVELEAISMMYKDPKERLYRIILTFLRQAEPPPTWRAIVKALKSPIVNLTALAKRMEAAHFHDPTASRDPPTTTSAFSCAAVSTLNQLPTTSVTVLAQSYSSHSLESQVSSDQEQQTIASPANDDEKQLKQEISHFERRFNQLKRDCRNGLTKKKIPVPQVVDALTDLPADDVDEHKLFLESHVSVYYQANDHAELIGQLSFHMNYLSYHLLDYLGNEFDLVEVKGKMTIYKSDLKQFRKKTPLALFCQTQKRKVYDPPQGFRKAVMHFDWRNGVTLEDVEQFRQKYASHYNLRECAMMISEIRDCSYIITWFIPESLIEKLKAKVPRNILKKYCVTELQIGGVCVYRSRKAQKEVSVPPQISSGRGSRASVGATGPPASGATSSLNQCKPSLEEDYLFVEQPSKEFFCPVTFGLLLEPHLTSCCGNHISQEAARRIQREEGSCPLCNTHSWSLFLNKHFQRQVKSLRVFCHHDDRGCGWQGELADFDSHVQSCPMRDTPLMTELMKRPLYGGDGPTEDQARDHDPSQQKMTDSPDSSSQAESQGGKTGEWTWKQKLSSGEFGDVFEAERTGCTDRFAAKRMTMSDSDFIDRQEEIVSAFFKELKALQECNHPRVVKYVDRAIQSFKSGIHFYIIMEYVAQGSLSDLMKKEGRALDELKVRKFTRQLLEGLLYLHQRSIIHHNIKCSNILLDENGDIKLADFGCVKFKKSKMNSGAKMTGTAWWMAPELIPGGRQSEAAASEKSDVWSVGATVVEMLTGKRPFAEHNEKMAVIFGLGNQSLSLDNLIHGPGFSDEAQLFLQLCINWEPSSRATVTELLSSSFVTT